MKSFVVLPGMTPALDGVGRAAKGALRDAAAEDMVDELISSAADLAAALLGNNK